MGLSGISAAAEPRSDGARPLEGGVLAGRVSGAAAPLQTAKVYAYRLTDLSLRKVVTDGQGRFLFSSLPAGLYKVIAHHSGFVPSVVMLARSSAEADQFIDVELLRQSQAGSSGADFWAVRRQIPGDVLREMGWGGDEVEANAAMPATGGPTVAVFGDAPEKPAQPLTDPGPSPFAVDSQQRLTQVTGEPALRAEMEAMAGIDQSITGGDAQLSGGRLGLDTRLGHTRVGLDGSFMDMEQVASDSDAAGATGRQRSFELDLQNTDRDDRLTLMSRNDSMLSDVTGGGAAPVEFSQHRLSWSRNLGDNSRSAVQAQYTEETNFYRNGWIEPSEVPEGSRTLRIEGSYATSLGEHNSFETALRYRQRSNRYGDLNSVGELGPEGYQTVELVSQGGWRVQPSVLVEYGLYTTLQDGSLSLTPRGGLVWQLNPTLTASASVSHKVDDGEVRDFRDFMPALFHEAGSCENGEQYCYRFNLTKRTSDDNKISFSALQREFDDTLRLYFNEDFFRHLESLYLVQGDRLPEVQLSVSRRISPRVVATLESNLASGGGGLLYALGDEPYENQVRYLVTSLDTHFQATSTGVFVAFHQLEQQLNPTQADQEAVPGIELERLELMLTQDLDILLDMASKWAVQLNMEISRGSSPFDPHADQGGLRKRFLGGLAVRF